MVDSHSRVRDARSLPHRFTPTTLPLVGLPRHGADGEGDDASGGRATAFALALIVGVILLGWATVAAVLVGR